MKKINKKLEIKGLKEIQKQISNHPGKKAHDEWKNFSDTYHGIYKENRKVLIHFLKEPSRNEDLCIELMQNVRPPLVREQYTNELLRHLYNFLSSSATLVDYTMKLTSKYNDLALDSYPAIRDKIKNLSLNSFVGKFRDYIVHYGVPPIGWTISLSNDKVESCVYFLNKKDLLQWNGWGTRAKDFIANKENLNLLEIVQEHGQKIDEEIIVLLNIFPNLHKEDIDSVNKIIQKRNDILSGKIKIK